MEKRFLLLFFALFTSLFLLAQNLPVEPPVYMAVDTVFDEHSNKQLIIKTIYQDQKTQLPPLPPSPPKDGIEEMWFIVTHIPEFPDGDKALLRYIYDKLEYPEVAKRNGVEGTVLVKFIIEKDGSITDVELIQDIGAGCGAAAFHVIHSMPRWNPGSPRGRPANWEFIVPIEFKLENGIPVRPTELQLKKKIVHRTMASQKLNENAIHGYVEYPPIFPGCDTIQNYDIREKCAENKLQEFIKSKLKYPKKARRNRIEGILYVSFIIEKDGSISNTKLMSDLGEGCGAEALRLVSLMPKWTPGRQRGQPIRYQYELPIIFSLK